MPKNTNDIKYLHRLQDYYVKYRGFPSYARLGEILGLATKSAVKKVLDRLQAHGYVERTIDDVWVPTHRFFGRPKIDFRLPAGSPMDMDDDASHPFAIDEYLITHPSRTLCIPVKGDSMIDSGIFEGDIVVVEQRTRAEPGDVVVAIVDNEFTLKRLDIEGGDYVLRPANPAYPPIRPRATLEIFGVVVGLIRKLRR